MSSAAKRKERLLSDATKKVQEAMKMYHTEITTDLNKLFAMQNKLTNGKQKIENGIKAMKDEYVCVCACVSVSPLSLCLPLCVCPSLLSLFVFVTVIIRESISSEHFFLMRFLFKSSCL